jgi:hypothetical protein
MKKKIINIYLSTKDKKALDEIKYKYHLSYSTIVNTITRPIYIYLREQLEDTDMYKNDREIAKKDKEINIEHYYKTSIKPREQDKPNVCYENATKMFIRKEMDKYIKEPELTKIRNMIYNEFQNTYEENWEGNKWHRLLPKMIKQNPEYYKKLLGVD